MLIDQLTVSASKFSELNMCSFRCPVRCGGTVATFSHVAAGVVLLPWDAWATHRWGTVRLSGLKQLDMLLVHDGK